MSIEDIILDNDRRGISALRAHLPEDFCDQAAALVLEHPGTAIITTGFYILAAGAVETDGPAGAIVIGNALQSLGFDVVYVTDLYSLPLMSSAIAPEHSVVDFPITDDEASKKHADDLLAKIDPSVVIAIERCGLTDESLFRNMHGQDITQYNARVDYLVSGHSNTVGIGDGGNEIGMGNLAKEVTEVPTLVKIPCVTGVSKLIISSVSNWGGYGLAAAMSKLSGKNLLPSIEEEQELVKRTVDMGAVDGMSAKQEYKVDGFTLEENSQTLIRLHEYLAEIGVTG